jgi:cell division protease FtsH
VLRAARAKPYVTTEDEMRADICVGLGGQTAERLVLGEASVGAWSDLQQANTIARAMVEQYGMGRSLGARVMLEDEMRREDRGGGVGEARRQRVDDEIDLVLREESLRCKALLEDNRPLHEALYTLLLERKVLDATTIRTFVKKEG